MLNPELYSKLIVSIFTQEAIHDIWTLRMDGTNINVVYLLGLCICDIYWQVDLIFLFIIFLVALARVDIATEVDSCVMMIWLVHSVVSWIFYYVYDLTNNITIFIFFFFCLFLRSVLRNILKKGETAEKEDIFDYMWENLLPKDLFLPPHHPALDRRETWSISKGRPRSSTGYGWNWRVLHQKNNNNLHRSSQKATL